MQSVQGLKSLMAFKCYLSVAMGDIGILVTEYWLGSICVPS